MDQEIQKYLNDLSSTDSSSPAPSSNDDLSTDEFLAEEAGVEEPSQQPDASESESVETNQEQPSREFPVENVSKKSDDDLPLYERFAPKQDQADKPEEPEALNNPVPLNITSEERSEQLEQKMKQIDLGQKEAEVEADAHSQGLGYINLKGIPIVPEALRIIDEDESKQKGVLCFMYKKNREIRLAALKNNSEVRTVLEKISAEHDNIPVKLYLTSPESMKAALKLYAALPKIIQQIDDIKVLEQDMEEMSAELKNLKDLEEKLKKINTTQILSLIISAGVKTEASDIHIEAEETGIQLRFRIDGVLHDVAKLDRVEWDKLISRIKLSSKLKINIKDKPQDGSFAAHIKGEAFDFRVSTLPTAYGESVVMRILYHQKVRSLTLESLGIEEYHADILLKQIERPNGMIVVTGPTGSGKTTTLYAILNKLNTDDNKIITVEDPIEYKIEGINQSEINRDKGYTFAKGLRSIVRQDPDIILVGEIRDKETAEISLNAALTGHLVFTTLHTNDAAGTIPRLLSLGAKPYLLAPALNISLAQRLVRKICPECKQPAEISAEQKQIMEQEINLLPDFVKNKIRIDPNRTAFYKGKGCDKCNGLGYKGQIGIFEIFESTDNIKENILSGEISEYKIRKIARENNMITMTQDGILKAARGITSLEEVLRVT